LSEQQVFNIYADISDTPSNVGGQVYSGFTIQRITALSVDESRDETVYMSVPLQMLYVAP